MIAEAPKKKRGRFSRISKARVFDGHPLRLSTFALMVVMPAYVVITGGLSLFFSYMHHTDYSLIFWSLPPGALLGFFLLVMERFLGRLKNYLFTRVGRLLTAFLLYFAHTIGYLALSSLLVAYPLGYLLEKSWGMAGMASKYSLFSVNVFIVLALISWLRNIRTPPCRCF